MKRDFDKLKIGDKFFSSRLMLGTGKYKTTKIIAIFSVANKLSYL